MPRTTFPTPKYNGFAIRDFRTRSGLKLPELAKAAEISYSHMDNIENQRKNATVEVLSRIATALDVRLDSILREPLYSNERLAA